MASIGYERLSLSNPMALAFSRLSDVVVGAAYGIALGAFVVRPAAWRRPRTQAGVSGIGP